MARRAPKPPRCSQCLIRGRTSKCDRKIPCAACVKANTTALCTYEGADPPVRRESPVRQQSPGPARGVRRPVNRDTPSNCYIPGSSTLSPPPSLDLANALPHQRIPDENAHYRLRNPTPLPFAGRPQDDLADWLLEARAQLAELERQVKQDCELVRDPIYRRVEAEVRATPSVTQVLRSAPTPGKQAPALQTLVSPAIIHNLKTGWLYYIPLTWLTTRARRATSNTLRSNMSVIKWNDKGQALVKDAMNLSDAGEVNMSVDDWVDAWKCHLWLVEKYQPLIAQSWSDHYSLIFHDPSFHDDFELWLRYDITVRKRWIEEEFDPGSLQEGIYKMVDRELAKAARDSHAHSRSNQATSSHSQDRYTRSQAQDPSHSSLDLQPGLSQASGSKGNRYHPYKPSGTPQNRGSSPVKCLRCGGLGHIPRSCSATSRANDVFATPSMAPGAATTPTANMAHTSAPSVEPPAIMPSPAPIDPRKVVTPLVPEAWHSCLSSLGLLDKFHDVPLGLTHGFRFGASRILLSTSTPPNHKSAQDAPEIIDAHIAKELSLGRYSGPFNHSTLFDLIGHFRSAPLGLVSKASSPGEYRMVQDFSYSHTKGMKDSVNDEIDVDEFPCIWSFFDDVVQAILDLPEGSMAATFDVDAAYRRIPIHPDDQPSIVVSWRDKLYIDHCAPFGAASSNGLFARCGDAMLMILQIILLCRVFKWVDDYLVVRPPPGYPGGNTTKQDVYNIAHPLGWPWKIVKTKDFANLFNFLGFLWDIASRTVLIPPKKCAKFLAKIQAWLSADKVSLRSTQELIGSLVHCTNVITDGRAWLAGLIRFSASFPHASKFRFITRPKPNYATHDALWWKERLSSDQCIRHLTPPPPEFPHEFFMDASTSFGIATIVDNHWASWRLMQGWKSDHRDIGWAEMSALELTLEAAIAHGLRDAVLNFRSDNQGVVFAMAAGRSRNIHQNDTIKRIYARASIFGLRIRTSYIASNDNPADPPSRGIPILSLPPISWTIPIPPTYPILLLVLPYASAISHRLIFLYSSSTFLVYPNWFTCCQLPRFAPNTIIVSMLIIPVQPSSRMPLSNH